MIPDEVLVAKNQGRNEFLSVWPPRNVIGIGVGRKPEELGYTWKLRFYVRSKIATSLGPASSLPVKIQGIPTEVVEAGRFAPLGGSVIALRGPVRPGSPIGHGVASSNVNPMATGTLGAVLKDEYGLWYILSNNHVLALNGRVPLGSPIVCPGSRNQFATLAAFVPLRRDAVNRVDAAVAGVTDRACVDPAFPKEVGKLTVGFQPDLSIGQTVLKVGRATGLSYGAIVDLSADFLIDYSFGTFRFERQLLIERRGGGAFADDGDSGSLVLDFKTRKPLALMFSHARGHTAACPIGEVLQELGTQAKRHFSFV